MSRRLVAFFTMLVLAALTLSVSPSNSAAAQGGPDDAGRCSPAREPVAPGVYERIITTGERERRYLVTIPAGYDPSTRAPVMMSLHGFTSSAQAQRAITGLDALADANSFIAVYPQGLATFPFPARWNAGRNPFVPNDPVDDVAYIRDLLADLDSFACMDAARVHATGFSAGAGMVNRLACDLADQITAIGGVAGAYPEPPDGCEPARPVPVILFHGSTDPIASIDGDERMALTPPAEVAAAWAERNGCDVTPEPLPDLGAVSGVRYTGCVEGADVVFYTVGGGGHTWPGGAGVGPEALVGQTSTDIIASAVMWDFFKDFVIREQATKPVS
ncbi:MAG: hypothetical protein IT323_21265 [Anaerolineae bacterium]|nr:hypothetical protein [Anaerolineae bacterium]